MILRIVNLSFVNSSIYLKAIVRELEKEFIDKFYGLIYNTVVNLILIHMLLLVEQIV